MRHRRGHLCARGDVRDRDRTHLRPRAHRPPDARDVCVPGLGHGRVDRGLWDARVGPVRAAPERDRHQLEGVAGGRGDQPVQLRRAGLLPQHQGEAEARGCAHREGVHVCRRQGRQVVVYVRVFWLHHTQRLGADRGYAVHVRYRYQLQAFVDKVQGRTPWEWIEPETSVTTMETLERVYAAVSIANPFAQDD